MNPQTNSELPSPQPEGQLQNPLTPSTESYAVPPIQETAGAQAVEQAPVATQAVGQSPLLPPSQPAPQPPVQAQPPLAGPYTTGTPAIADDTDLIEKEWVLKAKEIVARTRHDPYEQNKQVEQMKADYMKKRYNRDIRLTEQ